MTGYGCEVERYSNCDGANEMKGVQVHVQQAPDGGLRCDHDDGGGPHDGSDEKCRAGEKCLHLSANDDEICEAYLDPDNEGAYGETCRPGKVSVFGMQCVVWMSSKCGHEE